MLVTIVGMLLLIIKSIWGAVATDKGQPITTFFLFLCIAVKVVVIFLAWIVSVRKEEILEQRKKYFYDGVDPNIRMEKEMESSNEESINIYYPEQRSRMSSHIIHWYFHTHITSTHSITLIVIPIVIEIGPIVFNSLRLLLHFFPNQGLILLVFLRVGAVEFAAYFFHLYLECHQFPHFLCRHFLFFDLELAWFFVLRGKK